MIDQSYFWIIIFCLAVGTISIRGSFIFLSSYFSLNDRAKEIFSFIPTAILPALVTPAVYFHEGQIEWLFMKERLIVLIFATGFWFLTKSMFQTIVFGLSFLYILSQIF